MEKGEIGFFVFICLAILISAFTHRRMENFLAACLISTISTVVIFQVIDFFSTGTIDPFMLIAMKNSILPALVISIVTGITFYLKRKQEKSNNNKNNGSH